MDFINKYVTKGTVTAVFSVVAIVLGAFGQSALAAFFNDPNTVAEALTVVGGVGTLVAGVLAGVGHTTATSTTTAAS